MKEKEYEYSKTYFWKNYMKEWFGKELIKKFEENCRLDEIESKNGKINLEIYQKEKNQHTIVFSHGIAGYARILLPFIFPLFERGFNVVVPDLSGFGYNKNKGLFDWNTHLENLKDTVSYCKEKGITKGLCFLGGASMGGPLAYATDSRFNCADGLICWCLFDFADKEFISKETNTGKFTSFLLPFMKLSSILFGKMKMKTTSFVSYDTLTDSKEFNSLLKKDPQAGTHICLNGAISLVTQSKPDLPHEQYKKPVLICQPLNDLMTPMKYSKKVFDKLGSKNKKFVGFKDCAHFPVSFEHYEKWGKEVEEFVNEIVKK